MNCSPLHRIIKRFQTTRSYDSKPGYGRKSSLSDREKRCVIAYTKKNRHLNRKQVCKDLHLTKKTSDITLTRLDKKKDLLSHRPIKKSHFRKVNRAKRLAWTKEHLNWSHKRWMSMLFTDKTHFDLFNAQKKRVRRPKVRYLFHIHSYSTSVQTW